jgi:hypothetical protein
MFASSSTNVTRAITPGIEFVKDAGGAVVALLQHWAEGDRDESRRK